MMESNKTQERQLYPGITVRKKLINLDQQLTYIFDLDVQDLNVIDFQADFQGSQNISIKGVGKEVYNIMKTVEPRTTMTIAQIELHEGWKLKTKFRFLRRPIPKEKQLVYIKSENQLIENQRGTVDDLFKQFEINLMPLDQINDILQKTQQKFVDSQFPPQQSSILGQSDKSLIDDTVNHWRRPRDFLGKKMFLFQKSSCQQTIKNLVMGKLLDYAFHSVVVSIILKHKFLIQRLFFNQKVVNDHGVYRLQLCKNGEWQTVTIDDYIPCEPLAKPKFASTNSNQIWIYLLQKAYAKLHRRYLILHQLEISHILHDLTGYPTVIVNIEDPNIHTILLQNYEKNNIVVLFDIEEKQIEQDEFIPLRNYAYPIIGYEEQKKKIFYKILSHNHQADELSDTQVLKKFKYACICHVSDWQQLRIKGKFVSVETGSQKQSRQLILSRWYYQLQIHEPSQIFICLHQEDLLIGNNVQYKQYKYITLLVFQKTEKSKLVPLQFKRFAHNREFQISLFLKPGIYLIVPIINSQIIKRKIPTQKDLILDVFRKLDLLMRRELKYADLQAFFKVLGEFFNQKKFNQLLETYTHERKGLGIKAFSKLYNQNELYWKDEIMNHYFRQNLFLLSIHSMKEINVLIKNNIGTDLNNRAHCDMISKFGEDLPIPSEYQKYVTIKYLKSKSEILEYMAQNKYERKIELTLDCSGSVQYFFVPKSGIISCLLDSGEKKYIMKIIPLEKSYHQLRKQGIKVKVFE